MHWVLANIEDKELRKNVSHVGGHLADYMNTELVCRSGYWQKKYIVVYNAAYAEIYTKYRERLVNAGAPAKALEAKYLTEGAKTWDERVGDVFEIAVAHALYGWIKRMESMKRIWQLLELARWTQEKINARWQLGNRMTKR